jgi:flagellar basal-body rod modification protein FlgD
MAVTNLSSVAGVNSGSANATSKGSGEIAGNFQQFLLLLTTQLKNQSPLDPLDTNQFTQQLVQFASVEQQLKTNATLSSLVAASKASTAATAASLVGTPVKVDGSKSTFENGSASWKLTADKAATATITVKDSTGAVIATQTKALTAGTQDYAWDGRALNGDKVATGTFTISVSARDASGQSVQVGTDLSGAVSSVELSGEEPFIVVSGRKFSLASLKSIGG